MQDVALPESPARFDYQSLDPASRRLDINHIGDGDVIVFDLDKQTVVADAGGFRLNTGILVLPDLRRLYVSEAAADTLAVVDTDTLRVLTHIDTGKFPDGITYDPKRRRLFVSDECGGDLAVIDAARNRLLDRIVLGGESGNVPSVRYRADERRAGDGRSAGFSHPGSASAPALPLSARLAAG